MLYAICRLHTARPLLLNVNAQREYKAALHQPQANTCSTAASHFRACRGARTAVVTLGCLTA
ncbi:hypothetical protein E2C01_083593 [Portunus trituberculatus]|uniref:Uncharacterized protein n=1 Tax=Portunus trituberculatus TaxID=210409 RepID=A0A5B7J8F4_PORTR|nr:hypothetical protein [Portunus trituberculatus]